LLSASKRAFYFFVIVKFIYIYGNILKKNILFVFICAKEPLSNKIYRSNKTPQRTNNFLKSFSSSLREYVLPCQVFNLLNLKSQAFNLLNLKSQVFNLLNLKSQVFNLLNLKSQVFNLLNLKSQVFNLLNLKSQGFNLLNLKSQVLNLPYQVFNLTCRVLNLPIYFKSQTIR
jgi:hypothetical protein